MTGPGQVAIQVRRALQAGDGALAAALASELDAGHHAEVLLGAGIRDARGGFAAARALHAGDLVRGCALLARPNPDDRLDVRAAAAVLDGDVPDEVSRSGDALDAPADFRAAVVAAPPRALPALVGGALRRGASASEVAAVFAEHPLAAVVQRYLDASFLALGARPVVVLGWAWRARFGIRRA